MTEPIRLKIPINDNISIALWKITSKTTNSTKHIFLTHGTFSDRKVCLGIAQYLATQGYTSWIMEWRGHGESDIPSRIFNFETVALCDFPAVFTYLFEQEKIQKINCITHSGGGICLTMFLIKHQQYIPKIHRIAFFGCQAFGAADTTFKYISIAIGKYITALMGKIPARQAGAKAHDESYYMMKQWFNWNLSGQFLGENNFDYRPLMPLITAPILSICAKGDTSIAPKKGCVAFLEAFKNEANQLLYASKENGYQEDYNHSRILHSRSAQAEIWPVVLSWFECDSCLDNNESDNLHKL